MKCQEAYKCYKVSEDGLKKLLSREVNYVKLNHFNFVAVTNDSEFFPGTTLLFINTGNITYSGTSPFGTTILRVSWIRLYFIILSADVVDVREGDAFTCKQTSALRAECLTK